MKKIHRIKGIKTSFLVATLIVGLTSGVTYAILQSQQNILIGNSISTASANLQISTDNLFFTNSKIGFDFSNIVPGGEAMPITGHSFYLKNAGSTPLAIRIKVNNTPINPENIDLNKVNILVTAVGSGAPPQSFSLQSLIDSANSNGLSISALNIGVNSIQHFKLQASMTSDAITGQNAALSNIDFAFIGEVI